MAMTLRRKAVNRRMLAIDYPRQNEVIASSDYTIRVFAPKGAQRVGISIDQGPWKSCRPAVGYWWYDWSGYDSGEHIVVARGQNRDGSPIGSTPRRFTVALRK